MTPRFSMVDIHAHILPGLDDGPSTLDESLRMCETYVSEGVEAVVATPHMFHASYAVGPEAVRSAVRQVSVACQERGINLRILPGGDVCLHADLMENVRAGRLLTLADRGRFLLLELPVQVVPRIEGLVFELGLVGLTPVLSHPERNMGLQGKPNVLRDLVERGCLVQITGGSLCGDFGPLVRRAADGFLDSGLVHFVASDAHSMNHRRPELRKVAELLLKRCGSDVATRLLCRNPRKVAFDEATAGGCGVCA